MFVSEKKGALGALVNPVLNQMEATLAVKKVIIVTCLGCT